MPADRKRPLDDSFDKALQHYYNYLDSCAESESGDVDELEEILELLKDPSAEWSSILVSVSCTLLAEDQLAQHIHDQADFPYEYLRQALETHPRNAAAWSLAAHAGRITHRLVSSHAQSWYAHAAELARQIREESIDKLEKEDTEDKELIELLLLHQVVGVELLGGDEDDEDEDDEKDDDAEEMDDEWSASAVEATARFMTAMLASLHSQHDEARRHLEYFPLTHRLHPNVWTGAPTTDTTDNHCLREIPPPRLYESVLPNDVFDRLRSVFAPDAPYWKESDYDNRGYYSYFLDHQEKPANLIEAVIQDHLLPRVRDYVNAEIVGYEWWVHTRPHQANLGHNLHFDTDEALLSQDKQITHPCVSSVLYLSSHGGGATIVLDQDPEAQQNAQVAWRSEPQENGLLLFPGHLLHGVLPCGGPNGATESEATKVTPSLDDLQKETAETPAEHRLTFMVGFWTRRVPDRMKNRRLYGPCGPMPPRDAFAWVEALYPAPAPSAPRPLTHRQVTTVGPVWEELTSKGASLVLPKALDHRFFVDGSPQCFHDSLFERDEYDDEENC